MRISCFLAALLVLATWTASPADERKFPYEAIVDADEGEQVWSGPDTRKHYPTGQLNRGDKVIVRRHDPGGWCMITPPDGSFSWVRAAHVKREGADRGSLTANRVFVHTGSQLNPEAFTTVQADLSKGDAVEILGEQEFTFDDGPQLMLKIKPIRGEWRWILRKSIVAVDDMKSDPFHEDGTPRKKSGRIADAEPEAFARPVSAASVLPDPQPASAIAPVTRDVPPAEQRPGQARLTAIDQQFREMVHQEPTQWDLASLTAQYKQLEEQVGTEAMSRTIRLRMDAVQRYAKIHQDYSDFYRLTTQTRQRDQELRGRQAPSAMAPNPDPRSIAANPLSPQPAPAPVAAPQRNGFDGAGIVQKMAKTFPGGPKFVLVAPDGRMLTYLEPGQGVDLNRYVGRPMGITGQRSRREEWNADILIVQSLQPVQLRGM